MTDTATPSWAQTARIVRRLGFGATGAEIDAAHALGPRAWVEIALSPEAVEPAYRKAMTAAPSLPTPARPGKNATREEKQKAREAAREAVVRVVGWWLTTMITSPTPAIEKVTFGWHDHWATSARKVKSAPLMLAQNHTLRRLSLGSFTDLAAAMVRDPALLLFLDAEKNTAQAPNENLARELMELFTLGRDQGYTEKDVKEAARALTGWRVGRDGDGLTATFDARRHDPGDKTVLGVTGALGLDELVATLLARPEHPVFVASRWWRRLAAPASPSADTLGRLTAAYGTNRDSGALLRAIVLDPEFTADPAIDALVVTPVEWLIGAARALRVDPGEGAMLPAMLKALHGLGQVPMLPPDVSGWPHGAAWLSTASAQLRIQVAQRLAAVGNVSPVADVAPAARADAAVHLLGLSDLTPRTRAALGGPNADPHTLLATLLASPEYLVN